MMDDVIIFCAKYVIGLVALGWIVALWRLGPGRRLQFVLATIVTGIIALILSRLGSRLYYDPRPFVSGNVQPLIAHAADNGFPSDHSLLAMALAAITFFFHRKIAWIMLALTVIIGAARVLAHVHSPIDIIGAWVMAAVAAVAGYWLVQWFARRRANRETGRID
jgi:undecaprenyl-diphosphatase